ncbi:hypothetical protein [Herbaspirillum sp. RV1423]|uniref:hypothetical protein n=1 Tax=Herbaspirillum sp. RV1423 TaxID=1443993 RepID=UPI0004B0F743|nr:hypothetical protein [Herbaspirillum sp. RV1423]
MLSKTAQYLDTAVDFLQKAGLPIGDAKAFNVPGLQLLDKISELEPNRVAAIGAVMTQSSAFNAAVRDGIKEMRVYSRFEDITGKFDSIREDAANMAAWMADGKLDTVEKAKLHWMNFRRGSVSSRFNEIQKTFLEVQADATKQLAIEEAILSAYGEFSLSLKSAIVDAQEVLARAQDELDKRKGELTAANEALAVVTESGTKQAELELARDEAVRRLQSEEKRFQICKDLAEDSRVGSATAEALFTRVRQQMEVKGRVVERSASFFSTNETVMSGLAVAFTGNAGLAEATNALEAMKDGINKGLDALATTGQTQLEAGLKAGYGASLDPQAVQRFVNSVVDYQENSRKLIAQARKEATEATEAIDAAVEDGKKRFAAIINQGG